MKTQRSSPVVSNNPNHNTKEMNTGCYCVEGRRLTVRDDEEDEGSVSEQPQDGGRVGVVLRWDAAGRRLGQSRRKFRTLLED